MTFEIREILKSKQALRQRLAALPIGEKFRMLDVLRERSLALSTSRKPARQPRPGRPPRRAGERHHPGHEGAGGDAEVNIHWLYLHK